VPSAYSHCTSWIKKAGSKEGSNPIQTDAESQFYIKVMETVENLIGAKVEPKEVDIYSKKLAGYFLKNSNG
jgi:hypothetical protein